MVAETQQMQHEADELRAVAELLDALMGVCVVEDESDGHWVYEPRRRL